jgi:hypothetical protein
VYVGTTAPSVFLQVYPAVTLRSNLTKQGCQMVSFQTKNPNFFIFVVPWNGKCCYIFWSFGFCESKYILWPKKCVCVNKIPSIHCALKIRKKSVHYPFLPISLSQAKHLEQISQRLSCHLEFM